MAVSFNTGGQAYAPIAGACALTCNNPPVKIGGRQVEVSLDYVPSMKVGNLRPFLVGGLGVFISVPDSTPLGNNTSIRGAYVYGGGVEYDFSSPPGHPRPVSRHLLQGAQHLFHLSGERSIYADRHAEGGIYYRF